MGRNVKILDCTLRDGGRLINCAFPQYHIDGILRGLINAEIDIIEIGFLRGNTDYKGDSTFFGEMEQAEKCILTQHNTTQLKDTIFVLFADYGKEYSGWDFSKLPECDGKTITGIRFGFRKGNFEAAYETMRHIQSKGYKLFAQMIETNNYNDLEFLQTLEKLNAAKPYAVGIVDTFGCMNREDLVRYYIQADNNLDVSISIDFHTHNNMQLSFAFAQEIISMAKEKRKIVLDATLAGMGKGAGNLNIELLVRYLNSQYGYSYDFDRILDTIDEHILWIKNEHSWGYSLPSLMSALFSSHPNNVDYLLKKNRLRTKDIQYILSKVDAATRKRYDYEKLDSAYLEYSSSKFDDEENRQMLGEIFQGRPVLVIVFGATSVTYSDEIIRYIKNNNPVVISVNHRYQKVSTDFVFFGNHRRYQNDCSADNVARRIVTSNIPAEDENDIRVDYSKIISVGKPNYDNSTIMLLNLLRNIGVQHFAIAGLDGYSDNNQQDFSDAILGHNSPHQTYDSTHNNELKTLLKSFADSLSPRHSVRMLTPSIFAEVFDKC